MNRISESYFVPPEPNFRQPLIPASMSIVEKIVVLLLFLSAIAFSQIIATDGWSGPWEYPLGLTVVFGCLFAYVDRKRRQKQDAKQFDPNDNTPT